MRPSLPRRGRLVFAASLALLAVLDGSSAATPTLVDRLARLGLRRPFVARLSITTRYRPCESASAGAACGGDDLPPRELVDISAEATAALAGDVTPAALQAAALADLTPGADGKTLNRSIHLLTTAVRVADRPAPVLADLAAALLVRAEANDDARDAAEAIDRAARAVELEPGNLPARFNLALALEWWGLDHGAAQAWRDYRRYDSTSDWAAEAMQHLDLLTKHVEAAPRLPSDTSFGSLRRFADAAPQQATDYGWGELREWGDSTLADDSAAASRHLRAAEGIGAALAGRDAALRDAVRDIRAAEGDRAATLSLARAHRDVGAAVAALDSTKPATTRTILAATRGRRIPSRVLALRVDETYGRALVLSGDPIGGITVLRSIAVTDTAAYPSIAGNVWSGLGTAAMRGKDQEAGMRYAHYGSALLERAGLNEPAAGAEATAAEAAAFLGAVREGFARARHAMHLGGPRPTTRFATRAITAAQMASDPGGLTRAASYFADERLYLAQASGQRVPIDEARMAQLEAYANADRPLPAMHAGDATADSATGDTAVRAWLALEEHLARGRSDAAHGERRAALAEFEAVRRSPEKGASFHQKLALLGGARVRLELGDTAAATRDLEDAAALVDREGAATDRSHHLASLLDGARAVFDQLVMLRLATGDTTQALIDLERGRASFNRRGVTTNPTGPRWTIPAGTVALDYAQIGDTLLAWTIRGEHVRLTRVPLSRARLARIGERARLRLEQRHPEAQLRPALAWLYDHLIRPVEGDLPDSARLAIVADGDVPADLFGALYDVRRGRYLIEDHVVSFVPALRDIRPVLSGSPSRGDAVLVASDPAFDPQEFPGLDRLQAAKGEADSVARLYPGAVRLEGERATRDALVAALRRASVVHFAGHAQFDDDQPERSALVLAPGSDGQSVLTAAALEALDLGNVRLVVLSACETLRSAGGRSGGFAGFSQALLGVGAGGVVGASWEVNDRLSRHAMVLFHTAYRDSGDAAAALRNAQLALLHSLDPELRTPATWAAFRYAGN